MRHPLISFAAWSTVVTVVLSALWLAAVEEQVGPKGGDSQRSIGAHAGPSGAARAQDGRAVAPDALASVDLAAPTSNALRAQALAWMR